MEKRIPEEREGENLGVKKPPALLKPGGFAIFLTKMIQILFLLHGPVP
ncbi:hypothetical protein CHCC20335_3048 [Bacillus paralicheniformis]|nr:hypothetical protein CHCC20335_3048 [Bacillus paralicheniformis]